MTNFGYLNERRNKFLKKQTQLRIRYEDLSERERYEVDNEFKRIDKSADEFFKIAHNIIDTVKHINKEPEIKIYMYGFECPDISKVKNKEKLYNKIMEQFSEQLKEWLNIY
ncbi:hypothetical protein COB55_03865 [Candidatus Wolfebacteria bacterium]|nr:MAG: hypothetical protein COB55_03865 [Candidatus Wolfebacteria bacterium]